MLSRKKDFLCFDRYLFLVNWNIFSIPAHVRGVLQLFCEVCREGQGRVVVCSRRNIFPWSRSFSPSMPYNLVNRESVQSDQLTQILREFNFFFIIVCHWDWWLTHLMISQTDNRERKRRDKCDKIRILNSRAISWKCLMVIFIAGLAQSWSWYRQTK